jgi:hypothetical protein
MELCWHACLRACSPECFPGCGDRGPANVGADIENDLDLLVEHLASEATIAT